MALRRWHWGCGVQVKPPTLADPEIAAATFTLHLAQLWASGRVTRLGWGRTPVNKLCEVIKLPATRPTGEVDPYYVRLGAEYYDAAPPAVALVCPDTWEPAPCQVAMVSKIGEAAELVRSARHACRYPDGQTRQLVCFSFTAEYYMTDHSPNESELWQQGRHTVAATASSAGRDFHPQILPESLGSDHNSRTPVVRHAPRTGEKECRMWSRCVISTVYVMVDQAGGIATTLTLPYAKLFPREVRSHCGCYERGR